MTGSDGTKDFIHGRVRWQRAVKNAEMSFQSLRNIIATSTYHNLGLAMNNQFQSGR
jgi:hypothetical protein